MSENYFVPSSILLQNKNCEFNQWLKHKILKFRFKKWIRSYVIISKGVLYIYPDANSTSPKMAAELCLYNRIEKVENRKRHAFALVSNIESVPTLKFAAPSLLETQYSMGIFKEILRKYNQNISFLQESMRSNLDFNSSNNSLRLNSFSHRGSIPPIPTNTSLYINEDVYVKDIYDYNINKEAKHNNINIPDENSNKNNHTIHLKIAFIEELIQKQNKREIDSPTYLEPSSDIKTIRNSSSSDIDTVVDIKDENSNNNFFTNNETDSNIKPREFLNSNLVDPQLNQYVNYHNKNFKNNENDSNVVATEITNMSKKYTALT